MLQTGGNPVNSVADGLKNELAGEGQGYKQIDSPDIIESSKRDKDNMQAGVNVGVLAVCLSCFYALVCCLFCGVSMFKPWCVVSCDVSVVSLGVFYVFGVLSVCGMLYLSLGVLSVCDVSVCSFYVYLCD